MRALWLGITFLPLLPAGPVQHLSSYMNDPVRTSRNRTVASDVAATRDVWGAGIAVTMVIDCALLLSTCLTHSPVKGSHT